MRVFKPLYILFGKNSGFPMVEIKSERLYSRVFAVSDLTIRR